MAIKKLKLGTTNEVKLPAKTDKSEKNPKWLTKIGGKRGKAAEVVMASELMVDETPVHDSPTLSPEPTEVSDVATTPEPAEVEPTATDEGQVRRYQLVIFSHSLSVTSGPPWQTRRHIAISHCPSYSS